MVYFKEKKRDKCSDGNKAEGLKRSYDIIIASSEATTYLDREITKYSHSYKIDGFRKGKVPLKLIKQSIKSNTEKWEEIRVDSARSMINEVFTELYKKENITPVGDPNISSVSFDEENDFSFVMEFELFPEISEDTDISEFQINDYETDVSDSDINKHIETIMGNSYKDSAEKGYEAKDKDKLIIKFVGRVNGKEFEGGKADDFPLVLGSKAVIKGIEEQLIGCKKGEFRIIKTIFPDNYHMKDVAGKEVEFDITTQEILPHYTILEDFRDKYYDGDQDKMFNTGKQLLINYNQYLKKSLEKRELFDCFNKAYDFEIPGDLLKKEIKSLNDSGYMEADSADIAKRRIKTSFIISSLSKKYKIKASQKTITDIIEVKLREVPENQKQKYLQDQKFINDISTEALEQETITYILDNVTQRIAKNISVTELQKKFDEERKN